jgi:CRISPR-associated exonuclease Cas4
MGDLSERILKTDPEYRKVEGAIGELKALLNTMANPAGTTRLQSLSTIEARITDFLKKLMPSVNGVSLSIDIDDVKSMFANGISLTVNDGISTDVLAKGHGLQRCVVFTLLQALILNERNQLVATPDAPAQTVCPIVLAIEEPELYIHPQLAKLFFDVMRQFSQTDQVLYATHSPLFIDAFEYTKVALVRKETVAVGTRVRTCDQSAFNGLNDRSIFRGMTRLNPAVNELFFAKKVLLVEGPEDQIGITAYLVNEGTITNRIEEIEWSIIVAGGKEAIPFFQRVLNGFAIPYRVLHDNDVVPGMATDLRAKHERTNASIAALASANRVVTFPVKMEAELGLADHLKDQYRAHEYFSNPANISQGFKAVVQRIFQ